MDSGDPDAYQKGFVAGLRKMDAKAREQFAEATGLPRALVSDVVGEVPEDRPRMSGQIREEVIKAIAAKYDEEAEAMRHES